MAGLQRSSLTFRRSGSSGLVWDERLMSEDHEPEFKELRHSRSVGSVGLQRRRRDGGVERGSQACRARNVTPALDPPSPKVAAASSVGFSGKRGLHQGHLRPQGTRVLHVLQPCVKRGF
uniref:Uncharacterized protein n=1 Tax=Avena sativa TaxID=4498 RepID=A0ACD5VCP9_AVESA